MAQRVLEPVVRKGREGSISWPQGSSGASMERPHICDGTAAVRRTLQPARPSSGRRPTAVEQEAAARFYEAGRAARIDVDPGERLATTGDGGDVPMTEAEIRALEAEPPGTPVRVELPLRFPTAGAGVYTTYRGSEDRAASRADRACRAGPD